MNEFIEQFIIECRELVEQATRDLLALEQTPGDQDRTDGAFRAVHTLKGSAAIIEFADMGRALHAAEDALSAVRAGEAEVTQALISDCLTCIDQVDQWLDAMEALGEPPADAGPAADALVARFSRDAAPLAEPVSPAAEASWWSAVAQPGARAAVRYLPAADCFFRGEDPLALMAGLPGLLKLDVAPREPWPALEELDPFECRLSLVASSAATPAEVATYLDPLRREFELRPLEDSAAGELAPDARGLIEAQLLLAGQGVADGRSGRLASAARVAANVLRHAGRTGDAERFAQMAEAGPDPAILIEQLQSLLAAPPPIPFKSAEAPAPAAPVEVSARSLRVDVERVDALVRLTGELTVVKNALRHASVMAEARDADPKLLAQQLRAQHAQLNRLVAELQRSVLSIRVLPLRHVFQRFPRLVREMAAKSGRSARLVTEGDDTEADKLVVESLYEPLLHVLRNAVDHGVERPERRAERGKPAQATILVRAARQGDQVVVEVEDDGQGIDLDRVRQVAAERGVAARDAIAAMSDSEVVDLIFAPGFSTATEVSDLSGRGVGMDAVRTGIERLGGRVQMTTRPGAGSTVRFVLPFTLMMTRVMTVEAGGQVFGLPLDAVVETVKIARDRIVPIGAGRAFVLRDRTVPVFDLARSLGVDPSPAVSAEAVIVVAAIGGQLTGLEVDKIGDRLDVMLKAMDGLLSGVPALSGTTLMGDGRVLLVLDLQELLA